MSDRADPASKDAQLTALYQEVILDHYRRPRNKGTVEAPDDEARYRNPLCGDEVNLSVKLEGDRIADVRFTGEGCSISQASASMLTQAVKGKSLEEARGIFQEFRKLVHGEPADEAGLGQLKVLKGVSRFPKRMDCALVAWRSLHEVLQRRK